MTHDELKGLVADLAIGALDAAEARRVEAHLAGCPECAAELRSLTGTAQLLRTLPPIPAPAAGEASLLDGARRAAARMAEARAPAHRVPRWLLGLALGGAGAAAALLISLQLGKAPASRFDEGRGALEGTGAPATAAAAPSAAPSAAAISSAPSTATPSAAAEPAPAAPGARDLEEARSRRGEVAGGLGAAAPARPAAPPPAQGAPKRKSAPAEIGVRETSPGAAPAHADASAPAPASASASASAAAAEAVAEAKATPERDAERCAAPASANRAATAAPAAAKATARQERSDEGASAQDRAQASGAVAGAAPAAATARLAKGQAELGPAAPPPEVRRTLGCAGETRRTLWRDDAGRLVRREREGRLGGQAYRILETFDAAGRLAAARLEAGGRTTTADRAGVAEGRLAGLVPGLEVAEEAAAAEAAPPRCGP